MSKKLHAKKANRMTKKHMKKNIKKTGNGSAYMNQLRRDHFQRGKEAEIAARQATISGWKQEKQRHIDAAIQRGEKPHSWFSTIFNPDKKLQNKNAKWVKQSKKYGFQLPPQNQQNGNTDTLKPVYLPTDISNVQPQQQQYASQQLQQQYASQQHQQQQHPQQHMMMAAPPQQQYTRSPMHFSPVFPETVLRQYNNSPNASAPPSPPSNPYYIKDYDDHSGQGGVLRVGGATKRSVKKEVKKATKNTSKRPSEDTTKKHVKKDVKKTSKKSSSTKKSTKRPGGDTTKKPVKKDVNKTSKKSSTKKSTKRPGGDTTKKPVKKTVKK